MLFVLLLTVLAHLPALRAGFVYEDQHWLPSVLGTDNDRWSGDNRWSVARVLWDMDHAVYGGRPSGYHLTNLLVHLANGALVWQIAATVADPPVALVASSVFLLHPLQTEAVDYISGRTELASVSCVLLVMLLAITPLTWWRLIAMGILAFLAIETKLAVGVTLFALLPIVLWRRIDRRILIVFALMALFAAPLAIIKLSDASVASSGQFVSFAVDVTAWWRYLSLVLIPVGLSIDHDFTGLSGWILAMSIVGLSLYLMTMWMTIRRPIGIALAWTFATALPRMVIATNEVLNEHHFYGPMVGVALLSGLVITRLFQEHTDGSVLSELAVSQDAA